MTLFLCFTVVRYGEKNRNTPTKADDCLKNGTIIIAIYFCRHIIQVSNGVFYCWLFLVSLLAFFPFLLQCTLFHIGWLECLFFVSLFFLSLSCCWNVQLFWFRRINTTHRKRFILFYFVAYVTSFWCVNISGTLHTRAKETKRNRIHTTTITQHNQHKSN